MGVVEGHHSAKNDDGAHTKDWAWVRGVCGGWGGWRIARRLGNAGDSGGGGRAALEVWRPTTPVSMAFEELVSQSSIVLRKMEKETR